MPHFRVNRDALAATRRLAPFLAVAGDAEYKVGGLEKYLDQFKLIPAQSQVRCICLKNYLNLIMDPYLASYGVDNPVNVVLQLAQTTMRSELGKIILDKSSEERDALNEKIVRGIAEAAVYWGFKFICYEIRDITPTGIKQAMEMQPSAEREKCVRILESEGKKLAQILESEGKKAAQILESEGAMLDLANCAKGAAEALLAKSEATARGMRLVSDAMTTEGSAKAASLKLAEQCNKAFSNLAQIEELEESGQTSPAAPLLIEEADSNQTSLQRKM